MAGQFKITKDRYAWLIEKLIDKNKPNKMKDSLYNNLTFFDKIKLLFKKDHDMIYRVCFPLVTFMENSHVIMLIVSISIYIILTALLFVSYSMILAGISFVFTIAVLLLHKVHYIKCNNGFYRNSDQAIIIHYILAAFTFALPVIILEILIAFFIGNGHKNFKNYINNRIEADFVDYFNQPYYDSQKVVYLRHEIIKDVQFDYETSMITFDYDDNYKNYNCISMNKKYQNQFERTLMMNIEEHTSRQLNFKQLLDKLLYLDYLHLLNQLMEDLDEKQQNAHLLKEI